MPDLKITALTELLTPSIDDILAIVGDPSGSPETKKATLQNIANTIATSFLTPGAGVIPATIVVGTGSNADYIDIQTAIDALPAGGGKIYIQEGTYTIPTVLTLVSNLTMVGSGVGNTIIKQDDGLNGNTIYVNGKTNFHLRDFSIDGNKANNPSGDNGLAVYDSSNYSVFNVESYNNKLKGFVVATVSAHSKDGVFLRCESYNNDQDGIAIASGLTSGGYLCKGIKILYGNYHDNGLYGVGLTVPSSSYSRTVDTLVHGNAIKDNSSYGIEVFGAKAPIITFNHVEGSGNNGIDLGSTSDAAFEVIDAIVSGNTVKNGAIDGITVQSVDDSIITNNRCHDDQAIKTQVYGIYLNSPGSSIVMLNNCIGNKTGGIYGTVPDGILDHNLP